MPAIRCAMGVICLAQLKATSETTPGSGGSMDQLIRHHVEAPVGWTLAAADKPLIAAKSRANRLPFAVLLLFFRAHGRFPRVPEEIDPDSVAIVARQVVGDGMASVSTPGVSGRTGERHRAEIRSLLGFREATVADGEVLIEWLRDHAVADSRDIAELTSALEQRCRDLKIEPPGADRIERIVRAALHAQRIAGIIRDPVT